MLIKLHVTVSAEMVAWLHGVSEGDDKRWRGEMNNYFTQVIHS